MPAFMNVLSLLFVLHMKDLIISIILWYPYQQMTHNRGKGKNTGMELEEAISKETIEF